MKDDAAGVTAAAIISPSPEKRNIDACLTAIRNDADEALEALLTAGKGSISATDIVTLFFAFTILAKRAGKICGFTRQLIKEAYDSPNAAALLPVLYKNRANGNLGGACLQARDFLNENTPITLLNACLQDKDRTTFSDCVTNGTARARD